MTGDQELHWEELRKWIAEQMTSRSIPGVAVGILQGDEIRVAGFGVTSVDNPLPVTEETLFQIGSITKTFTGTAIMRLVETGLIDLDAPVRTYLPDFAVADSAASERATVRHLLTHVGGWAGDFFHDTGPGSDALPVYLAAMADLAQLAPVGTLYSYNNAGFSVAGAIIEAVTGQSFETALRELLFDPLGLERTLFDSGDVLTYRFAVGHYTGPDGSLVARPWPLPRSAYPAGGIVCHVKDLLRYARFHLGDGGAGDQQLLTTDSLAQMHSPQVTVWDQAAWGLTWSVDDTHGVRLVEHGGGTTGQISRLVLVPEHGFAFAVLTNSDRGGELALKVRRRALQTYIALEIPSTEPLDEITAADLAPYAGHYSRPFADIELGLLGGRLIAAVNIKGRFPHQDAPPAPDPLPMPLTLCAPDRLLVTDGPAKGTVFDVLRRADGSIGWLRAGRLHVRQ